MKKFSKKEWSWILYDWANSAFVMTVLSTILPIYFTSMVGESGISKEMATSYWGYTNSFASIIIAVLSPVMGSLADYMGVKKKFFTVFSMLGVIFTGVLAIVPYGNWQFLMITYVISLVGFSLGNVFYDSFLTDVSSDERMDTVSSWGYAMGYIGSTIPFIICMGLVIASQKGIVDLSVVSATRISFIITAIWWFVFTLPMLKNVEQIHGKSYEKIQIKNSVKKVKESFIRVKSNKAAFLFLCAYFFYIDGVDTIIRMATSFGTALGIDSSTLLIILLATQFIAFPFTIIYGKLSQKYEGKKILLFGIGIYIIICIYAFFMNSAKEFWILAIMVGSAQGGIQALSRSYFAKLIPKEHSNEFFGFYNIFGKFAAIIGPFMIAITTQITGDVRNGVLSLIILFIIGGYLLIRTNKFEKNR
ncbi:MAG: MFS transporter [Peptostreptococcus sp.]|uniref:MFS transporter n=1 Tax=Peptostreptococcus sp. TaxID=1262 RepID=UPI002FC74423